LHERADGGRQHLREQVLPQRPLRRHAQQRGVLDALRDLAPVRHDDGGDDHLGEQHARARVPRREAGRGGRERRERQERHDELRDAARHERREPEA
jgi:hypothetical protein